MIGTSWSGLCLAKAQGRVVHDWHKLEQRGSRSHWPLAAVASAVRPPGMMIANHMVSDTAKALNKVFLLFTSKTC